MNYIILNNKRSTEINGLMICSLPPISKPAKRISQKEIDGRDGDIITELGYKAYDKEFQIGLTYNYDVNEVISYFDSEGTVVFSNEPDKYYRYKIIEQIDFERLIRFKTATIKMHMQPFKYSLNEEYILSKDRKDKTIQGETIDITDSAEMRFSEFNVRGNSRQESRSGKNKLNCNVINNSETKSGVTATKNKDGSYTFKGTTTDNVTFYLTKNMNLEVTKTMIGSGQNNLTGLVYNVQYYKKDSTTLTYARFQGNIFNEGDIIDSIYVQSNETGILVSGTIFPQLEEGTTITDYEQYGATPSPDYPSEVESCGDNVNLFDKDNMRDNVWISTEQGDTESNTEAYITNDIYLKKGETIFIPDCGTGRWGYWDTDKTTFKYMGTSGNRTFTAPNDCIVLVSVIKSTVTPDKLKIEKGTKATPYSPYGQGCINEVVCNRNEFITQWEQGALNTDTGVGYDANNSIRTKDFIRVLPNVDYYISRTIATYYNSYFFYDINKNFLGRHNAEGMITTNLTTKNMQSNDYNQVITINNSQVAYMKIFDISNDLNTRYLLQRNSVIDKTYIEHQSQTFTIPTQQPMRAIGDIRDTFVKVDGKWVERHYINRIVLDGTNNKMKSIWIDSTNKLIHAYFKPGDSNYTIDNLLLMSNKFMQVNSVKLQGLSYNTTNGDIRLQIDFDLLNEENTTVDNVNSWLTDQYNAGTPVYVDYVLATPTDIECTPEQVAILNEIENTVKSYKGGTHIYSTDEVGANVEVTYFTPTNETINNEGNIQSRPILRLEKTVSEAVELTINDVRFKYDFGDDSYVEIDCEEKVVKYEGLNRNRRITIGYEFPKLNIGSNKIVMHDGDCIIKILRKDRWL